MNNRKGTPDILGDLMAGATVEKDNKTFEEASQPASPQVDNEINKSRSKPVDSLTTRQADKSTTQEGRQEKATFKLSASTLEQLDDAWIYLRRKFRDRTKATKNAIVEIAILMALDDLNSKDEQSKLFKNLMKSL